MIDANQYDIIQKQRHWLFTKNQDVTAQQEQLLLEVGEAKGRIHLQPDVKAVLEFLQFQEHERSVGAFERLLTAILNDILPGERKVILKLKTDNGTPSLDILIQKGEGSPPEDAHSGAGGAVSNILSMGLRMIALLRSGKRKFMILDEADCWLKPSMVPKFSAVIQQMSAELGLQILIISHHDSQHYQDIPYKIELVQTEQGLTTMQHPTSENPVWEDDTPGIRSIFFESTQAHAHTFLPLSPGVTYFCGENDLGKSAIVTALRAVFYGESNDTIIKHYQDMARVTTEFGGPDPKTLTWTRNLKGSPKISYMLTDRDHNNNNPLRMTDGARSLPEWLEEETGLGLIEKLDVQLGHQKDPIFLLNKTGTLRAKALSIGAESGYIQSMMVLDKQDNQQAKSLIKTGEAALEKCAKTQQILAPLVDNYERFLAQDTLFSEIQQSLITSAHAEEVLTSWRNTEAKKEVLSHIHTSNRATSTLVFDGVKTLATIRDAISILKSMRNLHQKRQALILLQNRDADALKELKQELHILSKTIGQIEIATRLIQNKNTLQERSGFLSQIPHHDANQFDNTQLSLNTKAIALLKESERLTHQQHSLQAGLVTLTPLNPLNAQSIPSIKLFKEWTLLIEKRNSLSNIIDENQRTLSGIQAKLDQYDRCPLCHNKLEHS